MSKFYKLDENNNVIPCDLFEWGELFETDAEKRRVGRDIVNGKLISTVFLGLDHSYHDDELHIFETMVFKSERGGNDIYCRRYPTQEEAELGHERACQWVREGCKDDD